jgi:hypothetical protein
MKNRLFIIRLFVILLVACIVLSGCSAGESFTLKAPGCTATWTDDITYVAWSKVDGADYYVVYGKKYDQKGGESPPSNTKGFAVIETGVTKSPYEHKTRDDYSYAVKAFKNNNKDSSDFSNVAFTW